MPCGSNDNRYTNDSNDINLSNTDGTGLDCNDEEVTTTTEATVIKQEIEEDTSPTDDDTFLSCRSNNAQDLIDSKDVKQLDLKYDYEIHTTNDSNLKLLVNKFESDLLKEIGEKYGLTACEFGRVEGVVSSSSPIGGIASTPVDVKDAVYSKLYIYQYRLYYCTWYVSLIFTLSIFTHVMCILFSSRV